MATSFPSMSLQANEKKFSLACELISSCLTKNMNNKACAQVMIGLHIGDSLGATSEYQEPSTVPALLNKYKPWPEKFAGNEQMWRPGQPTDDTNMAMCIWKAMQATKIAFDCEKMTDLYIEWMNSNPPDIGGTTKKALT